MSARTRFGAFGALSAFLSVLGSEQTFAQQRSALSEAMLEEIVVTARRREENLMELPLSIQAISAEAMQAQGIYEISDITDFVPNVALAHTARQNDARVFIRGIGGGFTNPSQIFGTKIFLDGHIITGTNGNYYSTADIERVEVLRGPQGTLFGSNTTGGLVNLITAKPQPEFESSVTLRMADFGDQSVRAMINFPLSENVFARVNFADEQNDGYYYNDHLGKYIGDEDSQELAIALRFTPGDWVIDARLWASEERDGNNQGTCREYPSENLLNAIEAAYPGEYRGPGPGPLGSYPDGYNAWGGGPPSGHLRFIGGNHAIIDYLESCRAMADAGEWHTRANIDGLSWVDNDSFNLDATWTSEGTVGPFEGASVQIRSAVRENNFRYQHDNDNTEYDFFQFANRPISEGGQGLLRETDEFEVIFNADVNDRLEFTAGVYWMKDDASLADTNCLDAWIAAYDPTADNGNPGPDGILGTGDDPPGTINGMYDDNVPCTVAGGYLLDFPFQSNYVTGHTIGESSAIYGHLTYAINDNWDLALGSRWMEDKRSQANLEVITNQFGPPPREAAPTSGVFGCIGPEPLPKTQPCNPTVLVNRETLLEGGIFTNVKDTFNGVTPMISLTRTLAPGDTIDSGIVYFSISDGWLTGAFNDELNANLVEPYRSALQTLVPYGPEKVTNYEVGFKGTLLDGRLNLAADIFYMDYTDKQEVFELDNADGIYGPDSTVEYTDNIADARLTGVELELRASPWDGGFVSVDFGWLDSKYTDYNVLNPSTLQYEDLTNTAIKAYTPDWTLTATVEHAFQLANGASLTPQLGMYTQDDYEWLALPRGQSSGFCTQESYFKWRARLSYVPAAGNWQAALFGYNITDEKIMSACGNGVGGAYSYLLEAPAQWGAEFTMRFGAAN